MQCGLPEHHGHYLVCQSNAAKVTRNTSLERLRCHLQLHQTCPGLVTWIVSALRGEVPVLNTHDDPTYFGRVGTNLLKSQSAIGWDAFRRGFISRGWQETQAAYALIELQLPSFDSQSWAVSLVQLLWQHGQAMWELRNESLHGSSHEQSRSIRLQILRSRVRQLYNHNDRKYIPSPAQKDYFGLPVLQRCKQGLHSLASWIQFVERRLHFHREEAMKRTIHAWLEKEE